MRIITNDGEFERELRQAGETLVVVDFTADWWVKGSCMCTYVTFVCLASCPKSIFVTTTVHVPSSVCLASEFESYPPSTVL